MKAHGVYRPNRAWYVLISVEKLSPCPTVVALALQCMAVAYPGKLVWWLSRNSTGIQCDLWSPNGLSGIGTDEFDCWVTRLHNSNHTVVPSNVILAWYSVHFVQ